MPADVESQIMLEELFNKNQTLSRLRAEFDVEPVHQHCAEHGIPLTFALDLLAQMVLHKRTTANILIGILAHHGETLQQVAEMLERAAEVDLVDYAPAEQIFVIRNDVSQDVYDDLERYQYPLPMVVPPRKVTNNRQTGYYSWKASIILRDNHHEDDVCLDHINRSNAVALSVNMEVFRTVQNQWRNLSKPKDGESHQDWQKRVKAFEKYDRTARDVHEHLIIAGNRFHVTYRYDKRGRSYAQGYHVNPQGNDWNKAVIEFADPEPVSGAAVKQERTAA